jgi:hypothetical protein
VSTVDWSTCMPCQTVVLPSQPFHVITVLPGHPSTSSTDVTHATCHPFNGDTCHLGIGPTVRPKFQICLTRVVSWRCHMSPSGFATCCLYGPTMSTYEHAMLVSVQTVRTTQSAIFFACLTFQTEHDIFSIRSPFDKVNIPPESGRRDGHNGVGFIAL